MTEDLHNQAMQQIADNQAISEWRDIDKHPLPRESCKIDVKLKCGSVLIRCNLWASDYCLQVSFDDYFLVFSDITQWRPSK